jgi:hypothetical protein
MKFVFSELFPLILEEKAAAQILLIILRDNMLLLHRLFITVT